ncbi:hypothetical protein JHK82_024635 [Glycine max]|nr:hypothetical protein JHK85_025239 [Glycine max]KAG5012479.1 hypothetical protein JHK86_024740 [Glycine max]KAG5133447.1 hypothetical protein JHK82_024635 [Glycine max]
MKEKAREANFGGVGHEVWGRKGDFVVGIGLEACLIWILHDPNKPNFELLNERSRIRVCDWRQKEASQWAYENDLTFLDCFSLAPSKGLHSNGILTLHLTSILLEMLVDAPWWKKKMDKEIKGGRRDELTNPKINHKVLRVEIKSPKEIAKWYILELRIWGKNSNSQKLDAAVGVRCDKLIHKKKTHKIPDRVQQHSCFK